MTHKQLLQAIKKTFCIRILCVIAFYLTRHFFFDAHNTKQMISYKCSISTTIYKVLNKGKVGQEARYCFQAQTQLKYTFL